MTQDEFYLWIADFYHQELHNQLHQSSSLNFDKITQTQITSHSWGCSFNYRWNIPQKGLSRFQITLDEESQLIVHPLTLLNCIQKQAQNHLKSALRDIRKKGVDHTISASLQGWFTLFERQGVSLIRLVSHTPYQLEATLLIFQNPSQSQSWIQKWKPRPLSPFLNRHKSFFDQIFHTKVSTLFTTLTSALPIGLTKDQHVQVHEDHLENQRSLFLIKMLDIDNQFDLSNQSDLSNQTIHPILDQERLNVLHSILSLLIDSLGFDLELELTPFQSIWKLKANPYSSYPFLSVHHQWLTEDHLNEWQWTPIFSHILPYLSPNFKTALPAWFCPLHVRILTTSARFNTYAHSLVEYFENHTQLNIEFIPNFERFPRKIKRTKSDLIPWVMVIGPHDFDTQGLTLQRWGQRHADSISPEQAQILLNTWFKCTTYSGPFSISRI